MPLAELTPIDLAIIAAFFVAVLAIGWRVRHGGDSGPEDFLLAGRRLTMPLFVGTLVATWYGGVLGVTEIAFTDGLASWVTQGWFWYVAYLLFALLLASRLNRSSSVTLPDEVGALHGEWARRLALVLNYLNVVPIAYALSLGLILKLVLGLSLPVGVVVGTAVALVYSASGGFRAVVYTDLLQFGVMCVAVALLVFFAVGELGGAPYLEARLPDRHLSAAGQMSGQELVVWALIAMSTLVDPNFYQRCFAAKSPTVARRGILVAVGFWALFDVCTTFGGLYARAAFPDADPRLAYLQLASLVLPSGAKGLFFAGILSTVLSTIDSYCFVGAMTLSHDIFRGGRDDRTGASVVRVTRIGVITTGALAIALAAVFRGSFKAIWKTMGSLSTAAMLIPVGVGATTGWAPRGAGLASMIAGAVVTLGWTGLRALGFHWAQSVETLLVSSAASLCTYLAVGLVRRDGGSHG